MVDQRQLHNCEALCLRRHPRILLLQHRVQLPLRSSRSKIFSPPSVPMNSSILFSDREVDSAIARWTCREIDGDLVVDRLQHRSAGAGDPQSVIIGSHQSGLKDVDVAEVGGGIFVLIRIASKRLDFAFELVERRAAVGSRSQYCEDSQLDLRAVLRIGARLSDSGVRRLFG
ncbi:hypothetical protein [Bradyrhizobium sp. OAE829]|uniref:hypothetical protein n=1 Tax=Bradyrhizobium sp. OAE829 TaxID=2663807 RepID=UPI0017892BDC